MKICISDSWNGKFSKAIQTHWQSLEHTVLLNEPWANTTDADIIFFYQADNVLVKAANERWDHKGKIFAQCVDIEVWAGQATAVKWDYVDGVFFMAPHIKQYVLSRINVAPPQVGLIRPGIDLDKFNLRPSIKFEEPIRRIAYVVGEKRIWDVKRFDTALKMLYDLLHSTDKLWQLHVLGSYSSHAQYNDYCEHLIDDLQIRDFIVWSSPVEDVSKWLDDKHYFFLDSTKEAFSYATAEAMAKGIKPVLGDWRGARDTWGYYVNKSYGEMLNKFKDEDDYKPEEYREYVDKHYNQKRYFQELDDFILGDFNPY